MKSVSPQIYSLISKIQTFQSVASFSLAGGTSLALRYNHRVSEAIDFFSDNMDYTNLQNKPSHSIDRLRLLPDSINRFTTKAILCRKVIKLISDKGQSLPHIKTIN
ncbi:MAG: hypothetical protein BWZ05_00237 [Bacteroidetes bacterium ADurb.BinA245]|nr:MAG: hypothetical protein BWZ05_00237 [Bacteroidetes bacterium ADurb.BinA245]